MSRYYPNRLTPRENQVAHLIGTGMTNKEMAQTLGISPNMVKGLVHQVLTKLDVPRRAAVPMALQLRGIVERTKGMGDGHEH